jgi:hypothetical protein
MAVEKQQQYLGLWSNVWDLRYLWDMGSMNSVTGSTETEKLTDDRTSEKVTASKVGSNSSKYHLKL